MKFKNILFLTICIILSSSILAADKKANTPTYVIGGTGPGGGIIFYVSSDGKHGLETARNDQSNGIQWSNGILRVTGTKGDGINAGEMNTAIIIATQISDDQTGNFAAKIAADYSIQGDGVTRCSTSSATETCYGDWYLPSRHELNLMYENIGPTSILGNVGGFSGIYWSSTEVDGTNTAESAWAQFFVTGQSFFDTKLYPNKVRAVRAF